MNAITSATTTAEESRLRIRVADAAVALIDAAWRVEIMPKHACHRRGLRLAAEKLAERLAVLVGDDEEENRLDTAGGDRA